MKLQDLEIPLKEFKGIGEKTVVKLEKNKIKTIRDLLFYFPYKYLDLTEIKKIKDIKINETTVICGKLKNLKLFPSPRKKLFLLQGRIEDDTGSVKIVWYNQPFLVKQLKENVSLLALGKLSKSKYGTSFQPLKFELLTPGNNFSPQIIPVYRSIGNLTSNFFEKIIRNIMEQYSIDLLLDPLPEEIRSELGYPSLSESLRYIHQPQDLKKLNLVKERFGFEEIFYLEVLLLSERYLLQKNKSPLIKEDKKLTQYFLTNLKLSLTQGQKKVLQDIFTDLQKGIPMNRLLQGETGSGKTLVAEIISLNTVAQGFQVIFMAPTEILAQQHFQRFLKDFSSFNYGLALLTSGGCFLGMKGFRAEKKIGEINYLLSQGMIKIIIGTHALIENNLKFDKVGLVIIDEQQRFGVEQRKKILENSQQHFFPHFISMTATPIPRSLALAFYGDLDFSYLEEKPFGQKQIKTYLVSSGKEMVMWNFVSKEIKEGHQIFIICPRVEQKEDEIRSVKEEYERVKKILPWAKIAMLHGKIKSQEKEKILKKMQKNEINVLVSSSVVEVGIDLPLATVVIIQSPERFGLSQLYQLKGRVGRSVHEGYCFLVPHKLSPKSRLRLKYFLQAKNSLELSEYDLKLRGGGELLGERQSGIPDLAMKMLSNVKIIEKAKTLAEKIFPDFQNKKYPYLIEEVNKRKSFFIN